ncbi:hypothetical protein JCM10213_006014 [Rhodosporidiobolus nylandii]
MDRFLPWSVLFHKLLPFFDFRAGSHSDFVSPLPLDCIPPWDVELEAWHGMFHPQTWVVLTNDDEKDWVKLRRVQGNLGRLERAAEQDPPTLPVVLRTETFLLSLERRMIQRWFRLLALHEVRSMYSERVRATSAPAPTDQEILASLPAPAGMKVPPAAVGQVWPLPVPPPLSPNNPPTMILRPCSHYLFP